MLKRFFLFILLTGLYASTSDAATPPASYDVGIIKLLYVDTAGNLAFTLDKGFPNATSSKQCTAPNGFAGIVSPNSTIKDALLTAKAMGNTVTIVTQGCYGDWFNVVSAYLN